MENHHVKIRFDYKKHTNAFDCSLSQNKHPLLALKHTCPFLQCVLSHSQMDPVHVP